MKKILASLLVLAICAPAMAVDFTVTDAGNQKVNIAYTAAAGEVLRGVALKVTVTGADIEAGTDVVDPVFNTKIDAAYTMELATPGSYTIGAGSGLAKELEAGALDANASVAVVSLGVLDQGGNQGGAPEGTGNVITIQLVNFAGATASVCVTADDLRGGAAVGDNLNATTITACDVTIQGSAAPCLGDINGSGNITTLDLTLLTNLLVDNRVLVVDPIFGNYYVYDIPSTDPAYIAEADMNESGNITTLDLTLLTNFLVDNRVLVVDPIFGNYYVYDVACP